MFTASDIVVLEGLEAVRRRPKTYIGDAGQGGLNLLIAELVGNAVGEVSEGHASRIELRLEGDSLSVDDDGRGIPVDGVGELSRLEAIFTSLHSGCNCGCDEPPGHRTGDQGVGVSVVNALSAWLEVETVRDGHLFRIGFAEGRVSRALEDLGVTERRGTRVTFAPDRSIFAGDAHLDSPWLQEHLSSLPIDAACVRLTRR